MGTDEYRPGTSILVDRLIHFTELAGEEKPVVTPSIKEEMFEENRFGDERDWYTVEGAFFLRRHNRAYCFMPQMPTYGKTITWAIVLQRGIHPFRIFPGRNIPLTIHIPLWSAEIKWWRHGPLLRDTSAQPDR